MKVIFTCGGTAGHVNPALALAGYMRKQDPTVEILFVGTPNGIERGLVAEAGYDYRGIEVGSFERSMDLDSLRHNAKSAVELLTLRRRAQAILREFPADLVVGTGGYASYPMVKYAALQGIPTAVHEANMIPGLTTRMLEKHASRIMVGFEECRIHYIPNASWSPAHRYAATFLTCLMTRPRLRWVSLRSSPWWCPSGAAWVPAP